LRRKRAKRRGGTYAAIEGGKEEDLSYFTAKDVRSRLGGRKVLKNLAAKREANRRRNAEPSLDRDAPYTRNRETSKGKGGSAEKEEDIYPSIRMKEKSARGRP